MSMLNPKTKFDFFLKKIVKVGVITFVTGWVATHAAGLSVFSPSVLFPLVESSVLAGVVYAFHNQIKHRKASK